MAGQVAADERGDQVVDRLVGMPLGGEQRLVRPLLDETPAFEDKNAVRVTDGGQPVGNYEDRTPCEEAIDRFLGDVYSKQRILNDGVIPREERTAEILFETLALGGQAVGRNKCEQGEPVVDDTREHPAQG